MIRLTRLRNDNALFLNPDHIERLDHHHDTIVRLFNGTEYIVTQTPDEIVELVVLQRARILAVAARLADRVPDDLVDRAAVVPVVPVEPPLPASPAAELSEGEDHDLHAEHRADENVWAPARGER